MFLKYVRVKYKIQVFSTSVNNPVTLVCLPLWIGSTAADSRVLISHNFKLVDFPGNAALSVKKYQFLSYSQKCSNLSFEK